MNGISEFVRAMFGAGALEGVAVALGLLNVGLLIRRSIWNYPFGLAMVTLYCWIFFHEKLYSDAGLQVFFFAIQIYGWINWSRAREASGLVRVERLSRSDALRFALATIAGWAALGLFMKLNTDAAYPFWDSAIAALSIAAQVMMARRRIENWLLWILTDILAIGLFWVKGLEPTAALYFIFLVMSLAGFMEWRRSAAQSDAS